MLNSKFHNVSLHEKFLVGVNEYNVDSDDEELDDNILEPQWRCCPRDRSFYSFIVAEEQLFAAFTA